MSLKSTIDPQKQQEIIQSDFELRKMAKNHQKFEDRLENLSKQKFISNDDQLEIKRIQKMKLALKDQMIKRLSIIN